jgi:hypothetical protein
LKIQANVYRADDSKVRTFWPTLRDTLAHSQSFVDLTAVVRRHLAILHTAAALVASREYDPPTGE